MGSCSHATTIAIRLDDSSDSSRCREGVTGEAPITGPLRRAAEQILADADGEIGLGDEEALPFIEARRIVFGDDDAFVGAHDRGRMEARPPPVAPPERATDVARKAFLHDDAFIDQHSGLVDRKLFLRLAKKGAFPATNQGRLRVARWGDVRRVLALDPHDAAPKPTAANEADALRIRWGLAPKGAR